MQSRAVLLAFKSSRNAEVPGAGAQAPVACLEGLEAPSRKITQGCRVCHGLVGSFKHDKP